MSIELISIIGKMRCGKDEVGSMIQYLTSQHGIESTRTYEESKDMVYDDGYAVKDFVKYTTEWQIRKYADSLKDMLCMLLGCSRGRLENDEFKNTPVGEEWWYYTDNHNIARVPYKNYTSEQWHIELDHGDDVRVVKPTPRMMLQNLGTDLMRTQFHPNVWVNATFAKIEEGEKVVITDTRFVNEAIIVKEKGGITINVVRPFALRYPEYAEYGDGLNFKLEGPLVRGSEMHKKLTHQSETNLDGYDDFTYTIVNDGTLDDLLGKVKEILVFEDIIQKYLH